MKTRVTLVRPPTFLGYSNSYPLNIGYIYECLLRTHDIHVDFVDGEKATIHYRQNFDLFFNNHSHQIWRDIIKDIMVTRPNVVAFSCYSVSMTPLKYLTDLLRLQGFNGQIWAGGIHPTTNPRETLEVVKSLNGIVVGEGEITFTEVCLRLHQQDELTDIKGIAYRKNGQIIQNPPRELIIEMDDLPIPTRTFSKKYKYNQHILLTSRGCPFNCEFCDSKNMWTQKVRYRSGEHVALEIKTIANLGVKTIGLRDDTFVLSKKHVFDVCNSITNHRLNELRFTVNSRIDTMNDDMIELLKKMNVQMCSFGVETGNDSVQKRIGKNLDIETVVPTVSKVNKAGIRTVCFFMIGHPDETEDELLDTFSLIKCLSKHCLNNNCYISIVCPYPGTGYWDDAIKKHGQFINFFEESYKYHHHSEPIVNITKMEGDVLKKRSKQILKYVKYAKQKNKILRFLNLNRKIKNHGFKFCI